MKSRWARARESGYPNLPERLYPYQVFVLLISRKVNKVKGDGV